MVYHILKDGKTVNDISGHIVRLEDANPLYQLLHRINQKSKHSKKRTSAFTTR